jgi:lysyl-tRNA synthetase class 1
MIYQIKGQDFWLDESTDAFLHFVNKETNLYKQPFVLASGMTPSCPIHFGIFREVAITHFIVEELRRRSYSVVFKYYWDDYDHFCKIPWFTTKDSVKEYIGMPLSEVPDLHGSHSSYAQHYMKEFESFLKHLGINPEYDYQSESYNSKKYINFICQAINKRKEIFDILHTHKRPYTPELIQEREDYYPLEIYCNTCKKDNVKVIHYDEVNTALKWYCSNCKASGHYTIDENFNGKLIWKANWAMRWFADNVSFEASGENQLSETGSYAAASKIVKQVFNSEAPFSLLYRFIGIPGKAKVSRALKEDGLAQKLIDLVEPAIIRYLLLKNSPDKSFSIDLDKNLERIYYEWDNLMTKVHSGDANLSENRLFNIAIAGVSYCKLPISFRSVQTAVGLSNGNDTMAVDLILHSLTHPSKVTKDDSDSILVRIACAKSYIFKYNHKENTTLLLNTKNRITENDYSKNCRDSLALFSSSLKPNALETEIQELLQEIPRSILVQNQGNPTNDEVLELRKELCELLYILLIANKKGPRLSTLISLAGYTKVQALINGDITHAL